MQKLERNPIIVDPFNTDFAKRWSWTTLGKALLNAAENHAKARGFGMMNLNDVNYTWVLSRLTIEMEEMPSVYEKIEVCTWIENIYRLFTNRNFSIVGADDKAYGYARSIWAMISLPIWRVLKDTNSNHILLPKSHVLLKNRVG